MVKRVMRVLLLILDRIGCVLSSFYLRSVKFSSVDYINERSIEYSIALKWLAELNIKKILEVGSGRNAFSSVLQHCGYDVVAADLKKGYWSSFANRHIHVHTDDITNSRFKDKSFDAIVCISTLEHINDYTAAIKEMSRIVRTGGILILTFPYSHDEFCDNVYSLPDSDELSNTFRYIARSFSDENLDVFVRENTMTEVERVYIRGWEGKFWRTGNRINFPYVIDDKEEANAICVLLRKN